MNFSQESPVPYKTHNEDDPRRPQNNDYLTRPDVRVNGAFCQKAKRLKEQGLLEVQIANVLHCNLRNVFEALQGTVYFDRCFTPSGIDGKHKAKIRTVGDLCAEHLSYYLRVCRTRKLDRVKIAAHQLSMVLGDVEMDEFAPDHWQTLKDYVAQKPVLDQTKRNNILNMRLVFKWGYEHGFVPYDVWRFVNDEPDQYFLRYDGDYSSMSFGDLLMAFLHTHLPYYVKGSRKVIRRLVRHFSIGHLALTVSELNGADIQDLMEAIATQHARGAVSTIKKYCTTLRTVFHWGYKNQMVPVEVHNLSKDFRTLEFARSGACN